MPNSCLRVLVVDAESGGDEFRTPTPDFFAPMFVAAQVRTHAAAREKLSRDHVDIVLVDRDFCEGKEGADLLRRVRAKKSADNIPLLIISGRNIEREVIDGFDLAADDYLPKPCAPDMFKARLIAVLRRNNASRTAESIAGPGFRFDPTSGQVLIAGRRKSLQPKEAGILLLLLRHPNFVYTARLLAAEVWGRPDVPYNSLMTRVSSLRRKLGHRASCIETIRGAGYRLVI